MPYTKILTMSTTTVKASSNGTAKKPIAKTKTTAKVTIAKQALPQLNLEDRIQRVTELQGLTAKRARVLETLNRLRTFKFSGDDSAMLEIKDAANNKFNTSNNGLIGLLSEHLETLLQSKLDELNKVIIEFTL